MEFFSHLRITAVQPLGYAGFRESQKPVRPPLASEWRVIRLIGDYIQANPVAFLILHLIGKRIQNIVVDA